MDLLLLIAFVTWQAVQINAKPQKPPQYCGNNSIIDRSTADVFLSERLFSLDLYKSVASNTHNNLAISTAVSFLGLSQLRYGAVGETKEELCWALRGQCENCYDDQYGYQRLVDIISSIQGEKLTLTNEVLHEPGLKFERQFVDIMNMTFRAEIQYSVDDELVNDSVLKWRKAADPNYDGFFQLYSYSDFTGSWTTDFTKCKESMSFYNTYSNPTGYSYMQKIDEFNYGKLDSVNARFVEIEWKTKEPNITISVYIILPNEVNGLADLEDKIDNNIICTELFDGGSKRKVRVILPEFKELMIHVFFNEYLRRLGVYKIFDGKADFSGITDKHPISVRITHRVAFGNQTANRNNEPVFCRTLRPSPGQDDVTEEFFVNRSFMIIFAIKREPSLIINIARYTGIESPIPEVPPLNHDVPINK